MRFVFPQAQLGVLVSIFQVSRTGCVEMMNVSVKLFLKTDYEPGAEKRYPLQHQPVFYDRGAVNPS